MPAGVILAFRMFRGRQWVWLGLTTVLALGGMWVAFWQLFRIVSDGAQVSSLAQTLAGIGGPSRLRPSHISSPSLS